MRTQRHRGSRLLYVAGSVGEFPQDVQDWLSRPENPAIASSNPYDALALLARGMSPAALLVSMQAIDWSEMEFFDHVAQLGRETKVFVSGPEHQRAKIEAACHRGASPFDVEAVSEALLAHRYASGETSSAGIMAGSFRPSSADRSYGEHADPAPHPAAAGTVESRPPMAENDLDTQPAPTTPPAESMTPGVRLVSELDTRGDDAEYPPRHAHDRDDQVSPSPDTHPREIPVPWSPSSQRPLRVPPGVHQNSGSEAGPHAESTTYRRSAPSVKLTQEELAALLGGSHPSSGRSAEEHGS